MVSSKTKIWNQSCRRRKEGPTDVSVMSHLTCLTNPPNPPPLVVRSHNDWQARLSSAVSWRAKQKRENRILDWCILVWQQQWLLHKEVCAKKIWRRVQRCVHHLLQKISYATTDWFSIKTHLCSHSATLCSNTRHLQRPLLSFPSSALLLFLCLVELKSDARSGNQLPLVGEGAASLHIGAAEVPHKLTCNRSSPHGGTVEQRRDEERFRSPQQQFNYSITSKIRGRLAGRQTTKRELYWAHI